MSRNAEKPDPLSDEIFDLDFQFDLDGSLYPLNDVKYFQGIFSAVEYHKHCKNPSNFSATSLVECFKAGTVSGGLWTQS